MSFVTWLRKRLSSPTDRRVGWRRRQRIAAGHRFGAEVQLLEERALLSGNLSSQFAVTDLVSFHSKVFGPEAHGTQFPTGYTPAQIRHVYGFDQISFNGTAGDGAGTTIAIVDSYDDPKIANDLHQFDLAFGLADPPTFTKVNQLGRTSNLPVANAGWITEIALDVEWAHAVAPGANILLVEANSDSDSDLNTAVDTARNYAGVVAVSMSWGGGEYSGETSGDSLFTTPAGHAGVTFVTSSGDTGAPTSYPSASPNVVSVGGTTLNLDASGNWKSETGWSGSGGGISTEEAQPSYQKGVVTQTSAFRADPDVAYDADPNTGFGVYDSYNNGTTRPWGQWGGTSDAAPQWAALIAIADQGLALAGKGSLDGATQTLPLLYGMSTKDFHDITSGDSTGTPQYSAGPGYDLVTGRGTPFANKVVNDLIGQPEVAPTLTTISTLRVAYQEVPFSISYATLLGASNAQDSNNNAIQFRIHSVQNGSLTITHDNVTTPVVADPATGTLVGPGDTLTWTGATGVSGNAVHAFTVTAFDGSLSSSPAVQVNINVQALGIAYDLSGAWAVNSASGVSLGLGQIAQSGSKLTFLNSNGVSSAGQYTALNQIVASNFDNQSSVAATIDTNTADVGRILWDDGTVWLRISLGGQYSVSGPGVNSPTLASISQNGISLTLVNGGTSTSATIYSTSQLLVSTGGGNTAATYEDGRISFSSNGQVWTKLDLPANFTSSSGGATQIIQNGSNLVFVNNLGQTSPGYWLSPSQVIATGFGNQAGSFSNGQIIWSTGEIWTENVVLQGSTSSLGTTTLSAGSSITVNDYLIGGRTAHVVQTGTNVLVFINEWGNVVLGNLINATQAVVPSWNNDVATFSAGKINFSDNAVWALTTSAAPQITVTDYTIAGLTSHVIQNGTQTLVFVNEKDTVVLGNWISPTQALVGPWGNDVATFGNGQINWSDGSVWNQNAPQALPVTILDYINAGNGLTAHVVQNGTNPVAFVNEHGTVVLGTMNNPTRATVGDWHNDVATFGNGKINWSDGSVWNLTATPSAKLALTNYTNAGNGLTAHVIQNGTTTAVFVNEWGTVVLGNLTSGTKATVAAWGGDVATFTSGNINWSDGSVWNKLTTAVPLLVTLTDPNGAVSFARLLTPTTVIGLDGTLRGLNGIRQNGQIVWSDGTVWDDLDFNALNALFEMSTGYP